VPETTIDKDSEMQTAPNDIGLASQITFWSGIHAVADSAGVQQPPHE
jgi:hypothetical protein